MTDPAAEEDARLSRKPDDPREPASPPCRRGALTRDFYRCKTSCRVAGLARAAGPRRTLVVVKVVGGFLGLLLGAFLGMIGLFMILYTGDQRNEQDIYVSFWDAPRIDADLIGVPLVVIGLALVAVSLRGLRRGGIP